MWFAVKILDSKKIIHKNTKNEFITTYYVPNRASIKNDQTGAIMALALQQRSWSLDHKSSYWQPWL